ncbi:hypothetical protein T190611E02C_80021 [Tenacibaculum sp. 190524A05c]
MEELQLEELLKIDKDSKMKKSKDNFKFEITLSILYSIIVGLITVFIWK